MSYTPSLARKKRNLRSNHCGSRYTLCSELGCGAGAKLLKPLQACLERAPQAKQYYTDAFPVYDTLYYGAPYELRTDKQETYAVEAVNADLRHYLKRLAREIEMLLQTNAMP